MTLLRGHPRLAVALTTVVCLLAWVALVIAGTIFGWWHKAIAPPGDAAAGIAGTDCARPDFDHVSPDGSKLLINRDSLVDGCGTLLLLGADGGGALRLNPEGTVAVDLEFGDFLERPRFSEAFSPDGSRIAFTAS